jgi:hypothetical protein
MMRSMQDNLSDSSGWQQVADAGYSYKMQHQFKMLSWNIEHGLAEFTLRFDADGGHCHRHRHLAPTTVLIIEGEQHLEDLLPGGETSTRVRRQGDFHRSTGVDVHGHMERGGKDGALIYYACQADDGALFELLDDDLKVTSVVTIADMVRSWCTFLDETRAG